MFKDNEAKLKAVFSSAKSPEEIYEKLLSLGKEQTPLAACFKKEEHLVKGCQSRLYLQTTYQEGFFYFATEADALISAGLGQTLVLLYGGLSGQEILTHKPHVLEEIGIIKNLSPSRSNGLASLDLKMRQEILQILMHL